MRQEHLKGGTNAGPVPVIGNKPKQDGPDYESLVLNALIGLYQPSVHRGEDFWYAVSRLFALTGPESVALCKIHGFDPYRKVLRNFKTYPYTRSEPANE